MNLLKLLAFRFCILMVSVYVLASWLGLQMAESSAVLIGLSYPLVAITPLPARYRASSWSSMRRHWKWVLFDSYCVFAPIVAILRSGSAWAFASLVLSSGIYCAVEASSQH